MIYTLGSCFYGIYFLVSYPVFYRIDESEQEIRVGLHSMYQVVMECMGSGMMYCAY